MYTGSGKPGHEQNVPVLRRHAETCTCRYSCVTGLFFQQYLRLVPVGLYSKSSCSWLAAGESGFTRNHGFAHTCTGGLFGIFWKPSWSSGSRCKFAVRGHCRRQVCCAQAAAAVQMQMQRDSADAALLCMNVYHASLRHFNATMSCVHACHTRSAARCRVESNASTATFGHATNVHVPYITLCALP